MSYKKTLIRLLDRPGGRFLLGKMATTFLRRASGEQFELAYMNGLWTRRIGSYFLPDSPTFEYAYADFGTWNRQVDQYIADTKEFWLQHYRPQEGDVVVDVGAGRGEDTLTFSRGVGASGRVLAIEAHPLSFEILRNFCRLNDLNNVTALQLAAMDAPGTVHILESASSWMENAIAKADLALGVPVRAATLDEVCAAQGIKDIAYLKMNIEGSERYALLGMESVLQRVEQICVACHDFRADWGHGEEFRTRAFVEQFLTTHGFILASRPDDKRQAIRDHIFGLRRV